MALGMIPGWSSSPVWKEGRKIVNVDLGPHGKKTENRAHQSECLPGSGLSVGKDDGVVTLHSRDDMFPRDLIVNGFILRSGDEFVEVEFWRSGG